MTSLSSEPSPRRNMMMMMVVVVRISPLAKISQDTIAGEPRTSAGIGGNDSRLGVLDEGVEHLGEDGGELHEGAHELLGLWRRK